MSEVSHRPHAESLTIDVAERGAPIDGVPQRLDARLFMQLVVLSVPPGESVSAGQAALGHALDVAGVASVIYADVNDPRGVGLLTFSQDPETFVSRVRPLLDQEPFAAWLLNPAMTMLGRTYSSGFENDLQFWMLDRPKQTVLNDAWNWAVWYPLRRSGEFEQLTPQQKGSVLREHATIGRAYGEQDLAHDVRLACHGLDTNDNEFVIGLVGKDLYPLSHVIQKMRGTEQTSRYISQMGPFFVGHAVYRVNAG